MRDELRGEQDFDLARPCSDSNSQASKSQPLLPAPSKQQSPSLSLECGVVLPTCCLVLLTVGILSSESGRLVALPGPHS